MATPEFFTNAAGESAQAEVMGAYIDSNFLVALGLGALVYFGVIGSAGHLRGKTVQGVQDTAKAVRG